MYPPQQFGLSENKGCSSECGKFLDISVAVQILREINFRDFGGPKTVILTLLEALDYKFYECLRFLKAEIYHINSKPQR